MFAAIHFRISAMPVVGIGITENSIPPLIVAVCLVWIALVGNPSFIFAQGNIPTPSGQSICDMPGQRGTAAYNKYCGACYPRCGNAGNSNNDNGAAQRAQEAAAETAAAAQRQRDAELEQQRIEADNKRRMEEIANQARFNEDKQQALGQLKGVSNGNDFDSDSSLKGVGSIDSGLRDDPNSGDSMGLKTLPEVKPDTHVVDARKVPSGLPKSVDDAIATAYSGAPPGVGDRVRKGFQAVSIHDWKLAKAWFGDALNHDPDNAGLKRLVELADYTEKRILQDKAGKSAHSPAPRKPMELPEDSDTVFLFPGLPSLEAKEMNDYMFDQALKAAENDPVLRKLSNRPDYKYPQQPPNPYNPYEVK